MPYFEVTYEDVGFTGDDTQGCELDEHFLARYSEMKVRESGLPSHVLAISEAYVTEDDAQSGKALKKMFISVTLVLEAESEAAVYGFTTPENILSEIASHALKAGPQAVGIDFEDSWRISYVFEATDFSVGLRSDNVSDY